MAPVKQKRRGGDPGCIVKPNSALGLVKAEELEHMVRVFRRHGVEHVKIASGQFVLMGVGPETATAIGQELEQGVSIARQPVQACPGAVQCKYGMQDSLAMGRRIHDLVEERVFPGKVKVGVAGCAHCCVSGHVRDVGLIARAKGWNVMVGGSAGGRPRLADMLGENLPFAEAVALVGRFLDYYAANAGKKMRTARFVEREGIENLRRRLLETSA